MKTGNFESTMNARTRQAAPGLTVAGRPATISTPLFGSQFAQFMTTRNLVVAGLAAFSFVFPSFAEEPIDGAFGQKFGEKFTGPLSAIQEGLRSAFRTAKFQPQNPYPGLDTYAVFVGPESHRVFEITAAGKLPSADAVKSLLATLAEKYGPFPPDPRAEAGTVAYAHRGGGRIVQFAIKDGNQVVLTFRDGAMTAAARGESVAGKEAAPRTSP